MTRTTAAADKALAINLDPLRYGTFAEIGAGQEVVRWFYRVGGAAGTIAKSISAYDMTVSDVIYGEASRYVSRERLQAILDHEQGLNLERLQPLRGSNTALFTFADTVQARSYSGNNECHGWMGVRFQTHPRDEASQIILHVRMLDHENASQQEALGIVGVNLLYGAFFLHHQPDLLVESLLDGLSTDRIEIDLIQFSGIEFRAVDNRVMSLRLVQLGLTPAAMFSASGEVLQPSEALRKKTVLVERGRFRPVTLVNLDMIDSAHKQMVAEANGELVYDEIVTLMEITMRNLLAEGDVDLSDFVSRADALAVTGHIVLVSDYAEYYRLASFLRRSTQRAIAIVLGATTVKELFDESYYDTLDGGILESFGRLFKNDIRVYVYPTLDRASGRLIGVHDIEVADHLRQLYGYLLDRGLIRQLDHYDEGLMRIQSPEVLRGILRDDDSWECMVADDVASLIKERRLFGYRPGRR